VAPAPTLPAEAQHPTPAGAVAFVRYYVDLYNNAFTSFDTQYLRAVSDSRCTFCASVMKNVGDVESKGRRVEGGALVVQAAVASPGEATDGLIVAARIDQEAGRTVDSSGNVATVIAAQANMAMDTAVRWDGRWVFLDAHLKNSR